MSAAHKLKVINLAGVLPPRRLQAVRLMVQGKTYREIAGEMGVTTHTVSEHLMLAMMKTGLSRVELALLVVARGLVKNPFA